MTPAIGHARSPDAMRRVVVSFDTDTFGEVRRLAVARSVSFAEAVRLCVEFGLEATNAEPWECA